MSSLVRSRVLLVLGVAAVPVWAQFGSSVPRRDPGQDVRTKPVQVDLVVERDGTVRQGVLQSCAGGVCSMDGRPLPTADIAWIALGVDPAARPPAPPADRSTDAVQVGGGALQAAPLVGINLEAVVTQRGSFPRERVDWIYLAPPPRRPAGVVRSAEHEKEAEPPPAAPPAPLPPTCPPVCPPAGTAPSTSTPAGTGADGAVWVGTIAGRLLVDYGGTWNAHTFSARVRARERIHPTVVRGKTVHETVTLEIDDLTIADTYESAETWPGGARCEGSGQVKGSSAPAVGLISRKVADIDLTPSFGYDVPAGGGFYLLAVNPPVATTYPATCRGTGGTWTVRQGFLSAAALVGRSPSQPPVGDPLRDPEVRHVREGRMAGAYVTVSGRSHHTAVSWSLCREGVDCPPPATLPPHQALPPTTNACAAPTPQQALLQLALDQQKAMADALARKWDEYTALARQSEQWKSDYEQAARDCTLTQVAKALTGFLLSNPGVNVGGIAPVVPGGVPPNAARALEQFVNFLNFMERATAGDAAWLLPDQSFKDFTTSLDRTGKEVPGLPNRFGGVLDAETIYDIISTVLGFLDGYVNESSAESLLADLRSCGGLTTEAVMDGAIRYLRLLQQLQPLLRDIQTRLNVLGDKDEEIFNLWSKYQVACLDYERCRGGNPAGCRVWPAVVRR